MENTVKAVIFDWGRTLHDPDDEALFPGVPELICDLSARYQLALVSLAKSQPPEVRKRVIEESGIARYFEGVFVAEDNKHERYEQALSELGVVPEEVVVVDDRMIRGVAWGNTRGATTVWVRNGKFADEMPTTETGEPTYTISDITELKALL